MEMNAQNYASLEASKKMADAGIMLETDFIYNQDGKLLYRPLVPVLPGDIPAPTMAEVWRELPNTLKGGDLEIWKASDKITGCGYFIANDEYFREQNVEVVVHRNTNPTDAFIDLLIWVKEQKRKEKV